MRELLSLEPDFSPRDHQDESRRETVLEVSGFDETFVSPG